MDRYPDISEHGLIGDLQTAALVSTDGTIDWFAALVSTPRASSPPCSTTTAAGTSASGPTGTTT